MADPLIRTPSGQGGRATSVPGITLACGFDVTPNAGDIGILQVDVAHASAVITTPSGWTPLITQTASGSTSNGIKQAIFWKLLTAGEAAPSVGWSGATAEATSATLVIDNVAGFKAVASAVAVRTNLSTAFNTVAQTAEQPGMLQLACIGHRSGTGSTIAAASGWTEHIEQDRSTLCTSAIYHRSLAAAGAVAISTAANLGAIVDQRGVVSTILLWRNDTPGHRAVSAVATGTTGATGAIGVPTNTALNDVMALSVWSRGASPPTIPTPSGWTLIGTVTSATDRLSLFRKVATASEATFTITPTGGPTATRAVRSSYVHVDTAIPVGVSAFSDEGAAAPFDSPTVATGADRSLVWRVRGSTGTSTTTVPSGTFERVDSQGQSLADSVQATLGSAGTLTWTLSAAAQTLTASVELRGEGAPPPFVGVIPTAIATGEAFGGARLIARIAPNGLVTAEAFGAQRLVAKVAPAGVGSGEAHGTARLAARLFAAAIASAEAHGATVVQATITGIVAQAIASAEAHGSGRLLARLALSGIATSEAFGGTRLRALLVSTGIVSAEGFGAARFRVVIAPAGLAPAEAFGSLRLRAILLPGGIASAGAHGAPTLFIPGAVLLPLAVGSGEAFGSTRFRALLVPAAIGSAQAFGAPTVAVFLPIVLAWVQSDPIVAARAEVLVGASVGVAESGVFFGESLLGEALLGGDDLARVVRAKAEVS